MLLATEDAQAAATARQETDAVPAMSAAEREDALELLAAPDLIDQVAAAFATLGRGGRARPVRWPPGSPSRAACRTAPSGR